MDIVNQQNSDFCSYSDFLYSKKFHGQKRVAFINNDFLLVFAPPEGIVLALNNRILSWHIELSLLHTKLTITLQNNSIAVDVS